MFKPEKLEEIPNFLTRYAECHVDELAAAEDVVFDAIRRIEAAEKVVDAARDIAEIAKYMLWESTEGTKKAKEVIERIHSETSSKEGGIFARWNNLLAAYDAEAGTECDRCEEKLREAERELAALREDIDVRYQEINQLAKDNLILRDCVEWYGDEKNMGDYMGKDNCGDRARKALAEI